MSYSIQSASEAKHGNASAGRLEQDAPKELTSGIAESSCSYDGKWPRSWANDLHRMFQPSSEQRPAVLSRRKTNNPRIRKNCLGPFFERLAL
ncbi:hypothetical protein ASG25_13270 [Rhizobium sp. Leaf384]|nr:hypothetical protein ASG58_06540 [Rhizobium sp. Leaf383]KQS79479.1 hypothetical protein ASG25_13270 [Rhizobium sp. Leaf384]